jgi:hypothetical protein
MDRRPALRLPPAAQERVRAGHVPEPDEPARVAIDRAIFASLPSPLARGYRIVAASSGLTEDEQREIVQRAPSHGNLSDASPQAQGMAGLMLHSGRYGLLLSKHAGPEPSGRGGLCVWTDALLLAPQLFRRFGCDPLRVEICARPFLDAPRSHQVRSGLPALRIPIPRDGMPVFPVPVTPAAVNLPGLLRAIASGLTHGPVVVIGAPDPRQVMQWILAALPAARREKLSFAYGLKLSSQRTFQLLFSNAINGEMENFARDHAYDLIDWQSTIGPPATPLTAWLEFVGRTLQAGRFHSLCALTDELTGEPTPAHLTSVAGLATAAAACEMLETHALEAAYARWRTVPSGGPVQRQLVERLRRALAERAAAQE